MRYFTNTRFFTQRYIEPFRILILFALRLVLFSRSRFRTKQGRAIKIVLQFYHSVWRVGVCRRVTTHRFLFFVCHQYESNRWSTRLNSIEWNDLFVSESIRSIQWFLAMFSAQCSKRECYFTGIKCVIKESNHTQHIQKLSSVFMQ